MSEKKEDIQIEPTQGILSRGEGNAPAHPTLDGIPEGGEDFDRTQTPIDSIAEGAGTTPEELKEVLEKSPETAPEGE